MRLKITTTVWSRICRVKLIISKMSIRDMMNIIITWRVSVITRMN